jgi:hypothetical protein
MIIDASHDDQYVVVKEFNQKLKTRERINSWYLIESKNIYKTKKDAHNALTISTSPRAEVGDLVVPLHQNTIYQYEQDKSDIRMLTAEVFDDCILFVDSKTGNSFQSKHGSYIVVAKFKN